MYCALPEESQSAMVQSAMRELCHRESPGRFEGRPARGPWSENGEFPREIRPWRQENA